MTDRPTLKADRHGKFLSSRPLRSDNEVSNDQSNSVSRGLKRHLPQNEDILPKKDDFIPKRQRVSESNNEKQSSEPQKYNANARLSQIKEKNRIELLSGSTYIPNNKQTKSDTPPPVPFTTANRVNNCIANISKLTSGETDFEKPVIPDTNKNEFCGTLKTTTFSKLSKNLADERLKRMKRSLEIKDVRWLTGKCGENNTYWPTHSLSTSHTTNSNQNQLPIKDNNVNLSTLYMSNSPLLRMGHKLMSSTTDVPDKYFVNTNSDRNKDESVGQNLATNRLKLENTSPKRKSSECPSLLSKKISNPVISSVKSTPVSKRLSAIRQQQKIELESEANKPQSTNNNTTQSAPKCNQSVIVIDDSFQSSSSDVIYMNDILANIQDNDATFCINENQNTTVTPKIALESPKTTNIFTIEPEIVPENTNTNLVTSRPSDTNKMNKWFNDQEKVNNVFDMTTYTNDSVLGNCNDTAASNTINASQDMDWAQMECDPILSATEEPKDIPSEETKIETKKSNDVCVVTDTNIFISNLDTVKNIMRIKRSNIAKVFVYVPWMVLEELDEIKRRTHDPKLQNEAAQSVRLIGDNLAVKDSRIIGQSTVKAAKQMQIGKSPDDKIIACCLQAVEEHEFVILLTNDNNLKNKAMVNDIHVCTPRDVLMVAARKLIKNTKFQKVCQKVEMLFSKVICDMAKDAYGDAWSKMEMFKLPPWHLEECLKIFDRYWDLVFQQKLLKQFIIKVRDLINMMRCNTIYDGSFVYNEFVRINMAMCIYLRDVEEFTSAADKVVDELTSMR